MHSTDLAWALLSGLALIYPLWRLIPLIERPGIRDLTLILGVLGIYPMLLAVFHLTPFDLGLVYSVTTFLPALYFFAMTGYVSVRLPGAGYWRTGIFSICAILGLLALTNSWHGQFAVFELHVDGQPNHMLDDLRPGIGMGLMHALSFMLVLSAAVLSLAQFLRSRLRPIQVLLAVVLPGLGLWSFTSSVRWSLLEDHGISGFILTTTAVLLVANYALARNHFIELRVVTRSKLLHLLPDAMLVLSPSGRILDCNAAFASAVDSEESKVVDGSIHALLPQVGERLRAGTHGDFELDLSTGEAPRFFAGSLAAIERHERGGQYLVVLRDVTEFKVAQAALEESDRKLRKANAALTRLSATDALTGLSNRRALMQAVEQAIARFDRTGHGFALLTLDIDHFKTVNDEFGHIVGDEALCHVARVLETQCRGTDVLARYGGEEFVVLLGEADSEDLTVAAERFRAAVEAQPLPREGAESIALTVSVGGIAHSNGSSMTSLMKAADTALYEAKGRGRNRVHIE